MALIDMISQIGPKTPLGTAGTGFNEDPLANPPLQQQSNYSTIIKEDPFSDPVAQIRAGRRSVLGLGNTSPVFYHP